MFFFVWTSQCEQGCSCVGKKKAIGRHSNQEKKQLTAKAAWIVFSEVLGELILIRDNSCHVHVKNSDKMVETISFHRRIFGRYLRRGVFYESHRKRIEFYLKKKAKQNKKIKNNKKTTRKVRVRAKHCGVRGWRWHTRSKFDLSYWNTEIIRSMIAFLNFVVNCVLFSSSLYSMSTTKSKEEKKKMAPILSRPRHFVLVLPRPFISQGLV